MEFRITIQQINDNGDGYKVSSDWHDHMKKSYKEATQLLNKINLCLKEEI